MSLTVHYSLFTDLVSLRPQLAGTFTSLGGLLFYEPEYQ